MFCPKCGAENTDGSQLCQKCGATMATEAPKPSGSTTSLQPNIAGLLCYVAGWISGLVFYLIEKENKLVRFHAMQSIITFGGLTVFWIVLGVLSSIFWPFWILYGPIWILSVVLWVVLMIKAYQGEKYKLPKIGDVAEKYA